RGSFRRRRGRRTHRRGRASPRRRAALRAADPAAIAVLAQTKTRRPGWFTCGSCRARSSTGGNGQGRLAVCPWPCPCVLEGVDAHADLRRVEQEAAKHLTDEDEGERGI